MTNRACIAIGINRYQFLPPLSYGQADAQALREFLVGGGNLPSSQCLLLTDTSPLVDDQPTYPSRENILNWLETGRQNSWYPQENWCWFFFSGCGVSWQDVDYLMPIDGNPDDIPGTGIPVRSLFSALQEQGHENILVILDINRSPGLQAGVAVGVETLELAEQMGIALVLSSQPDQFSHEAAALGNGLFTAALLEALRYYDQDTTLEKLDQYLRDRLPELSQHHWRPVQNPLIAIPSENHRHQLIFPSAENSQLNEKASAGIYSAFIPATKLKAENRFGEDSRNGKTAPVQKIPISAVQKQPMASSMPTSTAASNQTTSRPGAMVPSPDRSSARRRTKTPWWQKLLIWGGSTAVVLSLLIASVVLRNRESLTSQQAIEAPVAKESPRSPTPETLTTKPSPVLNEKASPVVSPKPRAQQPVVSPPRSNPNRLQANQVALAQAKQLIQPNQASLFSKAIAQAGTVKPGDPLYEQAQQDITRWSGVILDLAEGRAKQGNFGGAIATAQLVPKNNPSVYAQAQQSIARWKIFSKQQQQNKAIIQAARKQVRRNQASSYNRAIMTLRKVPRGQPGYGEAQKLIAQGSKTIYLIAQSRASRGRFQEAIQTAALVPSGTPYSDAAQKAIAKWKQKKV